jgi:hypothetical protein
VTITVNDVDAGVIAGSDSVCYGYDPATIAVTTSPSGSGTLSYQWQMTQSDCSGNFTDIFNATSATYNPGPLFETTSYRLIVKSSQNGQDCYDTSNCITFVVNIVQAALVGDDQKICFGSDPATITTQSSAAGSGTLTYQWQHSTVDCSTGFSDIQGATGTSYTPPAKLGDTTYYRQIVTSTLGTIACTDTSNCVTIVVDPLPVVTIDSMSWVCSDTTPFTLTLGTPAGGTYKGTGILNNTFYPDVAAPGWHTITYVYTDSNGCVDSASTQILVKPCGFSYCSYSQGFYGNVTGKGCFYDTSLLNTGYTDSIIWSLLYNNPMLLGDSAESCNDDWRSWMITVDDVSKVIGILPAGGPSKMFQSVKGKCTGTDWESMYHSEFLNSGAIYPPVANVHKKTGRIQNTLIGQTITMMFNVRNNPTMGTLYIDGDIIHTMDGNVCDTGHMVGVDSVLKTTIPSSILDYFGSGYTVNDLILLANNALSGKYVPSGSDPTLSEITAALEGMVNAFHDCRVVIDITENLNKREERLWDEEDPTDANWTYEKLEINVFPNPFSEDLSVQVYADKDGDYEIKLYNTVGQLMYHAEVHLFEGVNTFNLSDLPTISDTPDMTSLPTAMYFIRVEGENQVAVRKVLKKTVE